MTLSVTQRVSEEIDASRADLVAWLAELVRIPSVTCDEGTAQAFVAQTLRAMGLAVDAWDLDAEALAEHPGFRPTGNSYAGRPNVVSTLPGSGRGKSLLFNAHVDVVP